MKKIISLFQRNYDGDRLVRDEVVPGAEWVLAGQGVATEKIDGAACMIRGGKLYKRWDLPLLPEWAAKKKRKQYRGPWDASMFQLPAPPEAIACQDNPDENSGHWPHWMPVDNSPGDKHFRAINITGMEDGTWEAVGPHFQGNPYNRVEDGLELHGLRTIPDCPRTFSELKAYLADDLIEGVVWHHPDGRMVKIKRRDFGLPWPAGKPK